jgi:uracil-DNA glycosylase
MSTQTINITDLSQKLQDRLVPSGWYNILRPYFLRGGLDKALELLVKEKQLGYSFTPGVKHLFTAFENCPYSELKVVIVGQDPYPFIGKNPEGQETSVADGMAFSCSHTKALQPSLKRILESIDRTVYHNSASVDYDYNPDLTHLAKQGVLLLNTALTTRVGESGSHYDIWKPFIATLLDTLNKINSGLVFLFAGSKSREFANYLSEGNHYIFFNEHPAFASREKRDWQDNDFFNKCNDILHNNNNSRILW